HPPGRLENGPTVDQSRQNRPQPVICSIRLQGARSCDLKNYTPRRLAMAKRRRRGATSSRSTSILRVGSNATGSPNWVRGVCRPGGDRATRRGGFGTDDRVRFGPATALRGPRTNLPVSGPEGTLSAPGQRRAFAVGSCLALFGGFFSRPSEGPCFSLSRHFS